MSEDTTNKEKIFISNTEIDQERIREATQNIIEAIGENPNRQGLQNTPIRVARAYAELLSGYQEDPKTIINGALFEVTYDEMVIVRDIEFYSLCEHHILPFMGRAHVLISPADM